MSPAGIQKGLFVTLLSLAAAVQADVIVDTGTSGSSGGFLVNGPQTPSGQHIAGRFTTTQDYTVTSVGTYMINLVGWTPIAVNLRVYADVAGSPAGGMDMEQYLHSTGDIAVPQDTSSVTLFNQSTAWYLPAGTYWIAAIGVTTNWVQVGAPTTPMDAYKASFGGQAWTSNGVTGAGAFQIVGTPIPEPASLSLLIVPAALTLRRRSDRQRR